MYDEVDMPFSIHYPPRYKVSLSHENQQTSIARLNETGEWNLEFICSPKKTPPNATCEIHRVLIEAFRCLREQYGETLVLSDPVRAASFIYRSESALHFPHWDERFPWRVHFYQVACKKDADTYELAPERYGGFVCVRPWQVHLKAAAAGGKKELALKHTGVSPAVCEGYLRLRVSQKLSPTETQIARNYSAPYAVDAFDSIPFFSPEIKKSCGYIALAAALTIAGNRHHYSPYELAAVHASIKTNPNRNHTRQERLYDNEEATFIGKLPLKPIEVRAIIENLDCPNVRGVAEAVDDVPPITLHHDLADSLTQTDWRQGGNEFWESFSNLLNNYIYQGLPVLFSVDINKLYSDKTDDALHDELTRKVPTEQSACHLVLIHSLIRGTDKLQQDKSRTIYVVSDTRNLHSTGSVFLKMTAKRLWAAAARPEAPAGKLDEQPEMCYQPLAVCVPTDFQLLWSDLRALSNCHLELRERSQLRGFLISRVFPTDFLCACAGKSLADEIRKFREKVRMHNSSRYVWIVERRQNGNLFGAILDTRYAVTQDTVRLVLRGVYQVQQGNGASQGKGNKKKAPRLSTETSGAGTDENKIRQLDVWETLLEPSGGGSRNFSHSRIRSNLGDQARPFKEESEPGFTPRLLLAKAKELFSPVKGRNVEFASGHDLSTIIIQS